MPPSSAVVPPARGEPTAAVPCLPRRDAWRPAGLRVTATVHEAAADGGEAPLGMGPIRRRSINVRMGRGAPVCECGDSDVCVCVCVRESVARGVYGFFVGVGDAGHPSPTRCVTCSVRS